MTLTTLPASATQAAAAAIQDRTAELSGESLGMFGVWNPGAMARRVRGRTRISLFGRILDVVRPGDAFSIVVDPGTANTLAEARVGPAIRNGKPEWATVVGNFGYVQPGLSRKEARIGALPSTSFALHPDVRRTLAANGLLLELHACVNGGAETKFGAVSEFGLDGNQHVSSVLKLHRHALGLWSETTLEAWNGEPAVRFTLRVGLSDPLLADQLYLEHVNLRLVVTGGALLVNFAQQKGLSARTLPPTRDGFMRTELVLLRDALIGDAQAITITGVVLCAGADGFSADALPYYAPPCEIVSGTHDVADEAFNLFGLPDDPGATDEDEWARGQFALVATLHGGTPWLHAPHMLAERPGVAGGQADFGLAQLLPVYMRTHPAALSAVRLSIEQESARPFHFRETDVWPVRQRRHPDWCAWKHYTHYHPSYDKDRLGKRAGTIVRSTSQDGTAWDAQDPEHESINFLADFAALTGDRLALAELDAWLQSAVAQLQIDSNSSLDGLGNARAFGRSGLALLRCWVVTGDELALERAIARFRITFLERAYSAGQLRPVVQLIEGLQMDVAMLPAEASAPVRRPAEASLLSGKRIGVVALYQPEPAKFEPWPAGDEREALLSGTVEQYNMRTEVPALAEQAGGELAQLFVCNLFEADPRAVNQPSWAPWQEAFACAAHAALWLATGDPVAREAARRSSWSVCMGGVQPRADGTYAHGGYLAYRDGIPLTAAEWNNPELANVWGDQFREWIRCAFDIGAYFAELEQGDNGPAWRERVRDYQRYLVANLGRSWGDRMLPWVGAERFPVRAAELDARYRAASVSSKPADPVGGET